MTNEHPFDLTKCVRPNILALPPYTTMRDDYLDYANLSLLDANENSFGPSIPVQEVASTVRHDAIKLKQLFCDLRNTTCDEQDAAVKPLAPENVCLGVGSDESIDLVIRAFCAPGKDKILICPPTYGMYEVSAQVNNITVVTTNLDVDNGFALRPEAINEALDPLIKVVFICSPANPTGNLICRTEIMRVLEHPTWNGIVIVDEAYIDFAPGGSLARQVNKWPNLIISQLLNNLKGPYNMSASTIALATAALQPTGIALMEANKKAMIEQRERLLRELPKVSGFAVPDNATTAAVAHSLPGCVGSLRITVGTKEEVDNVLLQIQMALDQVYSGRGQTA
ncbi:pyridoxal phosphate-dependent transferase [Corynascus similis CBS 632.67]